MKLCESLGPHFLGWSALPEAFELCFKCECQWLTVIVVSHVNFLFFPGTKFWAKQKAKRAKGGEVVVTSVWQTLAVMDNYDASKVKKPVEAEAFYIPGKANLGPMRPPYVCTCAYVCVTPR